MTRSLLKIMSLLLIVFAVLCAAPLILGRARPHNSTLAGFTEGCEGQPQPCWYGIVPGMTEYRIVPNLLSKQNILPTEAKEKNLGSYFGTYYFLVLLPGENSGCSQVQIYQEKERTKVNYLSFQSCESLDLSDILFFVKYPGVIDTGCSGYDSQNNLIVIPASVRYPFATVEIKNTPIFYGANEVSSISLYEGPYKTLDEAKDFYEISYTMGLANETNIWKFLRVFLELSGCG